MTGEDGPPGPQPERAISIPPKACVDQCGRDRSKRPVKTGHGARNGFCRGQNREWVIPPETTSASRTSQTLCTHPLPLAASGSFASLVAITTSPPSGDRLPRLRGRASDSMTPLALALPPPPPLAAPLDGRRGFVPVPGDGLEPGD